ncbi:TIR domain-containing protein [Parabacteroides goldsteinii]|uniref:toll/interleukin-1 receptor domain-containing protein n=1 Tax=Parabacteroides goldsteinii TaxID=328812 RepID=UPI001CCB2EB8|nr:TIR domain-containing protein [Parabacteroides goldsteinii]UBD75716.1 TIR domain-containing protein [Parabacteroides goldsteinii]
MGYDYDVALSFAGEDRNYVDKVAEVLKSQGIKVFYDKFEEVSLWGKDLGVHFDLVYRRSAKYCIPFISKNYKEKIWTNHEIKTAIARSIETKEDYILPARLDETEIDGIRSTIGFIDLTKYSPEEFASLIIAKIKDESPANIESTKIISKNVVDVYLSQKIMTGVSDFSKARIIGASIGVLITNKSSNYKYFNQPFFKLSHPFEGGNDTFYLIETIKTVLFPKKTEPGEPVEVLYKLAPKGIELLRSLPEDTTMQAIVTTTLDEKFESNEILIKNLLVLLK